MFNPAELEALSEAVRYKCHVAQQNDPAYYAAVWEPLLLKIIRLLGDSTDG